MCCLVFAIPLHAARRAMAAACRCPRGQQPIFPPLNTRQILSPTTYESYRGSLISFPPVPPDKEKTPETKENYILFGPPGARPPPRCGTKLHLTFIPYIHCRGLRSLVPARGLGPPRSSWALRSPIALLLFRQPHSVGSAYWCPPMWCGWCVVWLV